MIDSTSGQNAIAQAQIFTEAMAVSGIVLTKLDGTAKGGVILGIADQLKIPVRYVGVGERSTTCGPSIPTEFVEALFAPLESWSAVRAQPTGNAQLSIFSCLEFFTRAIVREIPNPAVSL